MRKGSFHVSTILALIIAAIILIVFAPILIKSAYAVWDKILEALGIVKPSMLEKAVECSYYRCTEGCVKAQEYCKDFYLSACTLPVANGFYEGDFQVCGWNALQYPVELSEDALKDDEKVYTTESFDKMFTCILPAETETGISWGRVATGIAALGLAGTGCALALMAGVLPGLAACPVLFTVSSVISWSVSYNHLIIDTALVRSSKTGTCTYGSETATSLTEFKVNSSGFFEEHLKPSPTVYIASNKSEGTFGKKYTTVVLSMPTYVILPKKDVENNIIFKDTEAGPEKWRVIADGSEYIFAADIKSETWERCTPQGTCHSYCKEPYWIVVSVKNLTNNEVKDVVFRNVNEVNSLFNSFVLRFVEWEGKECKEGFDGWAEAYGSANFTITYYAKGIPESVRICSNFNNQDDCINAGCKWCKECYGHKVNAWKQDKCVDQGVDYGYTCVIGQCGAECTSDMDCIKTGKGTHCLGDCTCITIKPGPA